MIEIKKNTCLTLAITYLIIPTALFLLFFIRLLYSIPAVILLSVLYIRIYRNRKQNSKTISVSKQVMIISCLTVLLWCYFGGQGGLFYQSDDWFARNAIFRDLITHDWPVYYEKSDSMLIYYIGHWLTPAGLAKITGLFCLNESIVWKLANIYLWIWTALGVVIALLLLWCYTDSHTKRTQVITLIILIFFSGLDVIGTLLTNYVQMGLVLQRHIEWWAAFMQFSSNTTCLFWVFNQAVPAWIAVLYMLLELESGHSIKTVGFVVLITLISAPLPCVGICIYAIGFSLNNILTSKNRKELLQEVRNVFSFENLLSAVAVLPFVGSYYLSNNAVVGGGTSAVESTVLTGSSLLIVEAANVILVLIILLYYFPKQDGKQRRRTAYWLVIFVVLDTLMLTGKQPLLVYFEFILLEIGIYLIALYKDNKDNILFYLTVLLACICPYITVGYAQDFCMRASIPAIIVTMTMCIKKLQADPPCLKTNRLKEKISSVIIVIALLIGSVTPGTEFYRGISRVIEEGKIALVNDEYKTFDKTPEENTSATNFVSLNYRESVFYKCFAKQKTEK